MNPFTGLMDRAFIDAPCPRCSYPVEIQLLDVRLQRRVFCPNCKVEIQLVDDDGSAEIGLRKIDAAVDQLREVARNVGR